MRLAQKNQLDARAYDLDGGALARDMVTERISIDPMAMSATCVFSTGAMDRVGDVVDIPGIRTANHRRNPVVCWNHAKQLTFPIGRTVDRNGAYTIALGDDVATQTTFFSQSLPEAEQIFRLIDEGMINANSIAFDNKRVQPIFAAGVRKGLHILECDLLEVSWVLLPVNPEAVRKAIDSLVCGRALAEPIRRSLEPYAARAAAWANGVTLKSYDCRAAILEAPAAIVDTLDDEDLDDAEYVAELIAEGCAPDALPFQIEKANAAMDERSLSPDRLIVTDEGEIEVDDGTGAGPRFWPAKV